MERVILKVFDVGAKWAAIGVLLNVVGGIPMATGILISGIVTLIYVTFGGLWGVIITDLIQFIIQVLGSIVMFVLVMERMGGAGSITDIWKQLPPEHSQLFNDPYSAAFVGIMFFLYFLSYNGGSWSLATRYISSPSEKEASKAAWLSGLLYLIWPLILFFPMWAAPLILPGLEDPSTSYGHLMLEILPQGMIGPVIASLFAATMGMTSSDVNTIAAVITRDILPVVSKSGKRQASFAYSPHHNLCFYTRHYCSGSKLRALWRVLGLIVNWFGALLGLLRSLFCLAAARIQILYLNSYPVYSSRFAYFYYYKKYYAQQPGTGSGIANDSGSDNIYYRAIDDQGSAGKSDQPDISA